MDGLSEKPPVEKVHIYIGSRWGFRTWRCFGTYIGGWSVWQRDKAGDTRRHA